MNIRSKYNVGDTVFIVQYNNFSGTYTCFNYDIKYIIYDGSDIFYGFVYGIEAMENTVFDDKLTAQRMCDFLNSQLDWSE